MNSLPGAEPISADLAKQLATGVGRPGKVRSQHVDEAGQPKYTNRLVLEASPYLRQHAHNPVNWFAWGEEAFAEARRLQRPVFLSIGYSTCHWCHVMEEESFEDETIARFLNQFYIAIKVDREERPDIDAIYMKAVQRLTGGQGGWPLSAWLNHDREPYYGGTYFPPFAGVRGAQHGFLDVLKELRRLFDDDPIRVTKAAHSLAEAVRSEMGDMAPAYLVATPSGVKPDVSLIANTINDYKRLFDETYGGLKFAPKFPSNLPIRLLLRHHQRTGDSQVLDMATRSLQAMAGGGIYDHLAGGFHRYATDLAWLTPHFEKMLYDNAQLVVAYSEAFQVTGRADFARIVQETCDELLHTFAAPEGGFYSATDADSEGEEGRYFIWTESEIRQILGNGEDTDLFLRYYHVTPGGNFEGRNILHVTLPDEATTLRLSQARMKLLCERRKRTPPLRDEKIIAAWNGLALSAFATAGRIFGRQDYVEQAEKTAHFLTNSMMDPQTGILIRSIHEGTPGVAGFLDDYAFVTSGLLDLFEATSHPQWLEQADVLAQKTRKNFHDPVTGGYFMTGEMHEILLSRERPLFDGAEPSGTAVAWENAARLSVLTQQPEWLTLTSEGLAFYEPHLRAHPHSATHALLVLDFIAGPILEIVLIQPLGATQNNLVEVLQTTYCPRRVMVAADPTQAQWTILAQRIPWLQGKESGSSAATAFVCVQGHCELPTRDSKVFRQQLQQIARQFGER